MRSPSLHRDRLPGGAISWLTLVGLGVVLLSFSALIVFGSLRDEATARHAEHSGDLAEAYLLAQDAMSAEDEVENRLEETRPGAGVPREFEVAAAGFGRSLDILTRSGGARDRALAARARSLHAEYADAVRDAFAAAGRGDAAAVERLDDGRIDPAQDALQPLVNGTGPRYAVARLNALDDLQRGERSELIAALVAVPLGGALWIVLVTIFVRQRRRLDRIARAEVERLDEAAHTDSLTGLLNHRAMERDLEAEGTRPRVMAMLDVVGLKPVNDRRGHLAGDALLQGVAAALREEVAASGRAYRIGGDEFAIVLPDAGEDVVRDAVEAIRARVTERHPAGIRAGVATGTDGAMLRERASSALLRARRRELRAA